MMRGVQDGDVAGPCGGVGAELMSDPAFREDMQTLRDEHREDMQAWWDKYGADTSTDAAQKALEELRTEHWNEMRALFKKYGVELPDDPPAGRGPFGDGRGGCGGAGGCGGLGDGQGDWRCRHDGRRRHDGRGLEPLTPAAGSAGTVFHVKHSRTTEGGLIEAALRRSHVPRGQGP